MKHRNQAAPVATAYDFKHPARVNRDQLRTLENLHDNFARLLSSTFSGAMRAVVDVDTAFVDQTTYAEFIMSLSNPSCSYQFTLGPTNGQAIIDVAMPVVFGSVDRIFGGKGSSQGIEPRQMTPIEIGVINRIIKRVIEDLEATWEPILRVEISDIELETNPEFMQITASSEIVILLAFEVNATNMSGLVSVCYPFFTLEPILPRLGQQTYVRQHRLNKEELNRQQLLRLGPMDVPVVAELGRTKISLEEAENLKAGDIIRLPTRATDSATVYLGGKPKFLARPFAGENGELKLQVAGRVPAELQSKYGTVATTSEPTPEPVLLPADAGAGLDTGAVPATEGEGKEEEPEPEEVDPDEELDPFAEELGVRIGRVEMQVAGSIRQVPQKIMPDLDEPDRFVVVSRDAENDKLVPRFRGGGAFYVEKGEDGIWRPVA